jgi:positive regulator of sigma E activity
MSCGRPVKEEGLEPIEPPSGSRTETKSTMLLMLAIVAWFFGFFLLIPAFVIPSIAFILVCAAVIVVGALMLIARFVILRRYSRKVEEFREEASEKIKCKYCGSMNPLDAEKCVGCQAPL